MSIAELDPHGVTTEFVEFYLAEAGLDPDDYDTSGLAEIWRAIEEEGGNILLWYAVARHRKPKHGAPDRGLQRWPNPAHVQQKFYEKEGVAATP